MDGLLLCCKQVSNFMVVIHCKSRMYYCVQHFRRSSISKAVEYRFKEKINLKSAQLHDIVTSEGEC